jgi:PHD/YefM family antitoxin component YafN of YafNO toxin-antitoxin module
MNTIPAQEIKQRGISAVDPLLKNGAVHVIMRNRPRYVIMDEERYEDLLEKEEEAILARWREVQEDIANGRVRDFDNPEELRAWVMQLGREQE